MTSRGSDAEGPVAFGNVLQMPYFGGGRWVSAFNHLAEVRSSWIVPDRVEIHDVTLRDGEQTARIAFTPAEKILIAQELDALGVASIEPGLPATAEDRGVIAELASMNLRAKVKPLVRVMKEDVDNAISSGAPAMVLEFGINPYLVKHVYETTPDELVSKVVEFAGRAKDAGMEVEFMGWDVFRIPNLDYLHRFFDPIISAGSIDRLTVADTFGMGVPSTVAFLFGQLREWFPHIPLGLHVHNDFGLATATALVALTSGASSVHSSVNGLGERAGNVATEEVAVGLQYLLDIDAEIDLSRIARVSEIVAEVAKRQVAPNKPIVGGKLFEVESGIVVHIIDRMRTAGLGDGAIPYQPSLAGRGPVEIIAGRGTGRRSARIMLDQLDLAASDEQVDEITERVKQMALLLKNGLSQEMFAAIAAEVLETT